MDRERETYIDTGKKRDMEREREREGERQGE